MASVALSIADYLREHRMGGPNGREWIFTPRPLPSQRVRP